MKVMLLVIKYEICTQKPNKNAQFGIRGRTWLDELKGTIKIKTTISTIYQQQCKKSKFSNDTK